MSRLIFLVFLSLIVFKLNFAQQLKKMIYEEDTLITIGTYILADEKIYMSRDTLLINNLTTNIDSLKVKSFVMTAFSLGKEFHEKSLNNKLTNGMINVIQNKDIKYKFVNLKDFKLMNQFGDIYVPEIEKTKIIFTD